MFHFNTYFTFLHLQQSEIHTFQASSIITYTRYHPTHNKSCWFGSVACWVFLTYAECMTHKAFIKLKMQYHRNSVFLFSPTTIIPKACLQVLTTTSDTYSTNYTYPSPIKHCQGTDAIYEADNTVLKTIHAILLYSRLVLFL